MTDEYSVGQQPCQNLLRKRGDIAAAPELPNVHECYRCGGRVSFCENCCLDHHEKGYETCIPEYQAILRKCEQYWNEPGLCDAEIHAALEMIHSYANAWMSRLGERVGELEAQLAAMQERGFQFMVTGGPVVMAEKFDAMKAAKEQVEREREELRNAAEPIVNECGHITDKKGEGMWWRIKKLEDVIKKLGTGEEGTK